MPNIIKESDYITDKLNPVQNDIRAQLLKKIKIYKKNLLNRAKSKGFYENFGQKELREINDWLCSSAGMYTPT